MATYSSVLAWRIPWTEEPGRLQFMALQSQTGWSDRACVGSFSKDRKDRRASEKAQSTELHGEAGPGVTNSLEKTLGSPGWRLGVTVEGLKEAQALVFLPLWTSPPLRTSP